LKLTKTFPKMRPHDIVRDSHSHSRCSTVSLPLRHLVHKGFISFPILCKLPYRPKCPVSRPITKDSCCLLMLSSFSLALLKPFHEGLGVLAVFVRLPASMCFLSIQSPIARLTTLHSRPSTCSDPVN
jgi:hypothetical protein